MVDCSHGNSNKDYRRSLRWQKIFWYQIKDGNRSIIGLIIESNIHEGNRSSEQPRSEMKYGVSVTDACISWEMTDALLREIRYGSERAADGSRGLRGLLWLLN